MAAIGLLALTLTALYFGADYIKDMRKQRLAESVIQSNADTGQKDSKETWTEGILSEQDRARREREKSSDAPPLNVDVDSVMEDRSGSGGSNSSGRSESSNSRTDSSSGGGGQTGDSAAGSGNADPEETVGEMVEDAKEKKGQVERDPDTSRNDSSGGSSSSEQNNDTGSRQNNSPSSGSGTGSQETGSGQENGNSTSGSSDSGTGGGQQSQREPPSGPYQAAGARIIPPGSGGVQSFSAEAGSTSQLLVDLGDRARRNSRIGTGFQRTAGGSGWTELEAWVVGLSKDQAGYVTGIDRIRRIYSYERGAGAPPVERSFRLRRTSGDAVGILFIADNRQSRSKSNFRANAWVN